MKAQSPPVLLNRRSPSPYHFATSAYDHGCLYHDRANTTMLSAAYSQLTVGLGCSVVRLMARHFPEWDVIVRADEVIEGQRTVDLGDRTEIDAEPNFVALDQRIKLGKMGRTTSYEERDQLQIQEARIIYQKKSAHTKCGISQFAAVASLTPRLYIDPDEVVRRRGGTHIVANGDQITKHASDR